MDRRGGMMITTVVTMAVVAVLGTAIVSITRIAGQRGLQHNHDERAYYMAQAGLAYARTIAASNVQLVAPTTFAAEGDGEFELTLTNAGTYAYAAVVGKAGVGTPWEAHYVLAGESGGGVQISMPVPDPPDPPEPPEPPPPPPPGPTPVTPDDPATNIVDNMVFVYGTTILGSGSANVSGDDATIVLESNFDVKDLGGGTDVLVSTIYVGGNFVMTTGNSNIGSSNAPGYILISGNAVIGSSGRNIYGDIYVNGNFEGSQRTRIHGNVYVQGNVVLGQQGVWLADDKYMYYRGSASFHNNVPQWVRDRCIQTNDVPRFAPPDFGTVNLYEPSWYASRGYDLRSSGGIATGARIYSDGDYVSSAGLSAVTNVVIAAKGDIRLTGVGGNLFTGVLFAPQGQVTFDGLLFEGTVIAKDGFVVGNSQADIKFVGIEHYIASTNDYPFFVVY